MSASTALLVAALLAVLGLLLALARERALHTARLALASLLVGRNHHASSELEQLTWDDVEQEVAQYEVRMPAWARRLIPHGVLVGYAWSDLRVLRRALPLAAERLNHLTEV